MKRKTFGKILGVLLVSIATVTVVFWGQISESFGPMRQTECQCIICHRYHVEKWVCGSKVNDAITTNKYSDWIDTFTPLDHQHVWVGTTTYNRSHWFGTESIGCGGIPAIPRIFEQRSSLGELEAQKIAARFHELIKGQLPKIDFNEMNELNIFTNTVVDDPKSLLDADPQG
jgi:hypothetical protein